MRRLVWALIVACGCIEPDQLGRCEALLCPATTGCWTGDGAAQCVPSAALVACDARETGASCIAPSGAAGSCHAGACFAITCGDGWLDEGEVCDDGNRAFGDGCSIDCSSNETCGNGYVDAALGEACDDGNLEAGDGCQPTCLLARCGDGFVDPVEECDQGAANSDLANATCRTNCQATRCGDGIVDAAEICDDGNQVSGDGCSFDCLSNETCGNSAIDFFAGETCDDGADHVGHDGCTDACVAETALWGELVTSIAAQNRTHMVFDSARNVMVQVAASNDGTDRMTTWEYDGVAWRQNASLVRPTVRGRSALAYDSARKRVVLFGGSRPVQGLTNETWEYDGVTWRLMAPTASPPARERHSLTYDATRGVVVLFGGAVTGSGGYFLGDTWEYDGVTWTQGPSGPSARHFPAMAFDGDHVVLFGGEDAALLGDTWTYDGAWTQVTTTGPTPAARRFHRLAYDSTLDRMVMFGGATSGGAQADTWSFDGSSWTPITSAATPAARSEYAFGYDSARDRIVMFGGTVNGVGTTDTWELAGSEWSSITLGAMPTQLGPSVYDARRGRIVMQGADGTTWEHDGHVWIKKILVPAPSPRTGARMAYDSTRGVTVLFGGVYGVMFGDTWEYDGTAWTSPSLTLSPTPRVEQCMVFDERLGRVLLFGGDSGGAVRNDLYEYDPSTTTWVARSISPRPSGRYRHVCSYDPVRGRTVMFGGSPGGGLLNGDTWEYDGVARTWSATSPATSPLPRQLATMYFDPVRGRIVLHAGRGASSYGDTWEYDGVTWAAVTTPFTPVGGDVFGAAYDFTRGRALRVCRFASTDVTCVLDWRSGTDYDTCNGADDVDGDGLLGCDDPDCVGYCDPLCPRGSLTCAIDRPRCGDGVCNPLLEHATRCAADCP